MLTLPIRPSPKKRKKMRVNKKNKPGKIYRRLGVCLSLHELDCVCVCFVLKICNYCATRLHYACLCCTNIWVQFQQKPPRRPRKVKAFFYYCTAMSLVSLKYQFCMSCSIILKEMVVANISYYLLAWTSALVFPINVVFYLLIINSGGEQRDLQSTTHHVNTSCNAHIYNITNNNNYNAYYNAYYNAQPYSK